MTTKPICRLLYLDLVREGAIQEAQFDLGGVAFKITTHPIGWDFEVAANLIRRYDGFVDGFVLAGLEKKAVAGKTQILHPGYLALMRVAIKSPLYLTDEMLEFFSGWTFQKILKEQPQLFAQRKTFFHCAMFSPLLPIAKQAGAQILAGDMMLTLGVPVLLPGMKQIEKFLYILKPALRAIGLEWINPNRTLGKPGIRHRFEEWNKQADIIVSFGTLLDRMESFDSLANKILIVDHLSESARERLLKVKVAQIIEIIPDHPALSAVKSRHLSLLAATIDQVRQIRDPEKPFEEFILEWIQKHGVKPNRLSSSEGVVRRCAFIVHPLHQADLWRHPAAKALATAPKPVRDFLEKAAAHVPAFYYGSIKGVRSESSGQEVICDLYGIAATPKQLLSMDEELLYSKLVACAEKAQKNNAALFGLGAYTKVAGDAGVTVARRAPIPVTNGNSYSAATTLWAAKVMIDKMGLTSSKTSKAMVIGATGSIGRVSAMLVSRVVKEIVLVAPRPDKLLELRDEVQQYSPKCKVKVTTNPNEEIMRSDLIVTATSNQSGKILDMMRVKPGAVICDCSRPLDITKEDAERRPDVMVIQSGEVLLPGQVRISCDIGLPKPSVYACLAETVLLTMDGRYEAFSLSKQLSVEKVREIYKIGVKHGAKLSEICGPHGVIEEKDIEKCKNIALERLKNWPGTPIHSEGVIPKPLTTKLEGESSLSQVKKEA